jgi:diguanylate cyclase (GGDEF)-like protein/hemerythrin-like metal-binding protein
VNVLKYCVFLKVRAAILSPHLEFIEVFPWNKNLETGIDEIDFQHKKLVDLLNKLANTLITDDKVEVLKVFDELALYAAFHFESEERIWSEKFGDDSWFNSHVENHASFLPEVLKMKDADKEAPLNKVVEDIVKFLIRWLAFHILDDDKKMGFVLQGVEQGMSLNEAKISAEVKMSGSVRVLIDTVMHMYNGLSSRAIELMRERAIRKKVELELTEANTKLVQANEMLESLSITDQLTGLSNRRHFEYVFIQQLKRCRREQCYFSLIMLDIDYFKKLNDKYGHSAGDIALRKVAQALKVFCKRPEDFSFRLGGEEFCIITSFQNHEETFAFAEKIGAHVASLNIPNQDSTVSDVLTVSLGFFTEIPNNSSSMDNFLVKSDENLYKAKKSGRNAVVG